MFIFIIFFSQFSTAAAPVARVTSPRTSCVAPCAIYFDARTTTDADYSAATWRNFTDLHYSWNFGDPSSGTWSEGAQSAGGVSTGQSKNIDTGFVAGHVYESPGTYNTTLTVLDESGNSSSASINVTIVDPNVQWQGSNTVCISSSATPVAGVGGCPSGASVVNASVLEQALTTNACHTGAKRCLFKRGDTFTSNGVISIGSPGPRLIGAYGSGAKPIVNASGLDVIRFTAGNTDTRIVDLFLNGSNLANTRAISMLDGTRVFQMLILRVDMRRFDGAVLIHGSNGGTNPSTNIPSENAFISNTVLDAPGLGGVDTFMMWEKGLYMGNRVGDKFDGDNGLGEHNLRAKFSYGIAYSHNSLGLLNDTGGRIGCGTIRAIMKIVSGLSIEHGEAGISKENVFIDNYISGCKNNSWDMDIGRTDSTPEKIPEGERRYIVERNFFTRRYSADGGGLSLSTEGDSYAVRNNTFDLASGQVGIRVWNRAPVANPPIPTVNAQILNNSFYQSTGAASRATAINVIDQAVSNTTVRNNLLFDAGTAANATTFIANASATTVLCPAAQVNCNLTASTNPYAQSIPTRLLDFMLTPTSAALNIGTPVPVLIDANFNSRPQGIGFDVGAFELSSTTPPPQRLNPPGQPRVITN